MKTVEELAREANLGTVLCHNSIDGDRVWIEGTDWHDELSRFRDLVLEEAAKSAETQLDEAEEARADKAFKAADYVGNPEAAIARGKHWLTVSTCNAVVRNCVSAIRAMKGQK